MATTTRVALSTLFGADYLLAIAEQNGTRAPIVPPRPYVRPPKLRECPSYLTIGWHHVVRPEDQERVRRDYETAVFTTPAERAQAKLDAQRPRGEGCYPCAKCGKFAFNRPGVICFWCL
jgi:hypothetical protein